jgi:predicted negative regulator of RcsB-dependent stress response
MYITMDTIIEIGKVIGALGIIGGFLLAIYKVFIAPKENRKMVENLKAEHETDIKDIKTELCVLNYAVLAALDALRQQGYNGEVTNAHEKLSKHLNQQAHNQT